MKWLDIAWADQGVHEIAGSEAEPKIIAYFRDAGRADITSDEVPWCAGFVGACLSRAGVPPTLPPGERLLARSYLKVGVPIDRPSVGCIAVLTRDNDPAKGHVGFVVGETDTHIALLGGNQSNAVNVRHRLKGDVIGYRWPVAVTPQDLDASGSRIASGASSARRDAAKAGGSQVVPPPPEISPEALVGKGTAFQGTVEGAIGFINFLSHRWPYLMAGVTLYYVGRIVWTSGWLRRWRAEDASTGAHVGRATLPETNAFEVGHAQDL